MSLVFLSYSLQDEREAAIVRDELRKHGLNVWWDAELPVGKNWAAELGRALQKSDSMIVLVSPSAMASDLVRRELEHAISNESYRNRLFPVIVKQTPVGDLPGYFRQLPVFDATKDRSAALRQVAEAIRVAKRGRLSDKETQPARPVVRAGPLKGEGQ